MSRVFALLAALALLNACGQSDGPSACLSTASESDRLLHEDWWKLYSPRSVIPASNGSKFGLIGPDRTVVAPFVYDDIELSGEGSFVVQCGKKYGFVDDRGEEFVPVRYDYARRFSEGLAAISIGETAGFVDPTGEIVISLQFQTAGDFSEGLAVVQMRSGGYGYIDSSGELAIEPDYSFARPFSEGLAAVDVAPTGNDGTVYAGARGLYGFVNRAGEMVIPPRFSGAREFQNGAAIVNYSSSDDCLGGESYCERAIDRTGEIIGPEDSQFVMRHASGNLILSRGELSALYAPDGREIVGFQAGGLFGIDQLLEEQEASATP